MKFSNWIAYFKSNIESHTHSNQTTENDLSLEEKSVVADTLQKLQKQKRKGHRHLIYHAVRWCLQAQDTSYLEAVKHFIAEEHRQADNLASFMRSQGIPTLQSTHQYPELTSWLSLNASVIQQMTNSTIANAYYFALSKCTNSKPLRQLCHQFIHEEEMHVDFHCHSLNLLQSNEKKWFRILTMVYYRLLVSLRIRMTWLQYYRIFQASGLKFNAVRKLILAEYCRALKIITHNRPLTYNDITHFLMQH